MAICFFTLPSQGNIVNTNLIRQLIGVPSTLLFKCVFLLWREWEKKREKETDTERERFILIFIIFLFVNVRFIWEWNVTSLIRRGSNFFLPSTLLLPP